MDTARLPEGLRFDAYGLIVAVAQDHATREVLMVAYMTEETLKRTVETGLMTYWSRSRSAVWVKGETSGNYQEVRDARIDCDGDALLFSVAQRGDGACHTGRRSCFFRRLEEAR